MFEAAARATATELAETLRELQEYRGICLITPLQAFLAAEEVLAGRL